MKTGACMTAPPSAVTRIVVRCRAGWIARLPTAILAALRVTFIYGEAQRWCPPRARPLPPAARAYKPEWHSATASAGRMPHLEVAHELEAVGRSVDREGG
jgi:hypothetical protein